MRMVIAKKAHPESEDLIAEVRVVGYKLQAAKPVGE